MIREAIQIQILVEPLEPNFFSRYANQALSLKDTKTVRKGKIILKGPGIPTPSGESSEDEMIYKQKKVSRIPMQTRVGDIVYYANTDGLIEIEEDDKVFHVITENQILYFDREE